MDARPESAPLQPAEAPSSAIVIVTAIGSLELLDACLGSLAVVADTLALNITVVDNASQDGLVDAVMVRHPAVTVHPLNRGVAAGVITA